MISSTCFEPEGSSSGRRFYMQSWHNMFYMHSTSNCLHWCM